MPPTRFPMDTFFTNMIYLFWQMEMYPWLLWYNKKAQDDKIFSNGDRNPKDIIKLVTTWEMA